MSAEASVDLLYTEVPGTTCYLDGRQGTVTGIHYAIGRKVGAFVNMTDSIEMRFVTLDAPTGERGAHQAVRSWRVITRDEFDRINGFDGLRLELGWVE